ncbi:MAG TPA: DUF2058 family protein [Rhodanobacteraceae bacterium]|nr:DUF2058 family protein [Rhodanobacteraceae bacterium]
MSDSLREQLLKAGFVPVRADKQRKPDVHKPGKRADKPAAAQAPRQKSANDFDLARAYAIRAQTEKTEREQAQREAQRQAQERRERKRRLHELLNGNTQDVPADAEHVRHFEHAGKIRRIHVSADQLAALNKGELGVVVQGGRFVLVTRETALQASEIAPESIALLVDPNATPGEADDGVPDDLMW